MKKQAILAALLGTFLLTGCANKPDGERNDSLEGFNRTMWKFNYNVMDRYVLEPVTKGWNNYVPKRVSSGLTSMANNLDEPVSFVNRLIEGEPKKAFVHFNRFWINTIFGLGGFVDFASASKELRIEHQRGFGETLGSYGVDAGTYIVLPIYNATTPRQLTGAVVDAAYMYPFWEWIGGPWSLVKYGVQAVDTRAKNLDNTELLRQAQDPYVTFREAYYQNLQFKGSDGKAEDHKETRPDDVRKEIDQ